MASITSMSAGIFRSMGGDIIAHVDIVPDPATIQSQLMEAAGNLDNTMLPMMTAKRIVQEDIQAHFDTESDPDGDKWVALETDYARQKESYGFPPDILHAWGVLEKLAVSDAAFVVTPQGLFYNWEALPGDSEGNNVGQIHQAGSIDAGTFTPDLREGHEGETLRFNYGVGRGNALPARPFVGMSQDAEAAVITVFDVWFDESVDVVIHPKTGAMQHRVSGKFGKAVRF